MLLLDQVGDVIDGTVNGGKDDDTVAEGAAWELLRCRQRLTHRDKRQVVSSE